MRKLYKKKIIWTIKNIYSLKSEEIYFDEFVVGDSKWRLRAYPNGCEDNECLPLYLDVADSESLPEGWERLIKYRLTVVNHIAKKLSQQKGGSWFDQKNPSLGFRAMLPLTKCLDINGVIRYGEVTITAKVGVLVVIGKSNVFKEALLQNEIVYVKGFQVYPSQVESVNNLFEKQPDIASELRLQNPLLRTTYLTVLLNLSEILCQPPEKLSNDDLVNAYSTLSYLTKAGFKLDWLHKKLKETGETRMQKTEEELKDMKRKFCWSSYDDVVCSTNKKTKDDVV